MLEPLRSRRILITRPGEAGRELEIMLSGLGATCTLIPTIETVGLEPREGWRRALAEADALLITSKRGLIEVLGRAPELDRRLPLHCAGDGSADCGRNEGFGIGVVSQRGGLQDLVLAMKTELEGQEQRIFWPASRLSRSEPLDALAGTGLRVERFDFYDTGPARGLATAGDLSDHDVFIFASPSAFKAWMGAVPRSELERVLLGGRALAIGATTARALELGGWQHIQVAARPSNEGILASCLEFLT